MEEGNLAPAQISKAVVNCCVTEASNFNIIVILLIAMA